MEQQNVKPSPKPVNLGALTGAVLTLLVLFWLLCVRTVGAGQVGIVTRFGDVQRVADSGITFKLPYPIERLEKMETRVQKEEQEATAATTDMQDVNAKLALNYALDNETALNVYKKLGKDYKNRVVIPAVQESFKAASAGYTAQELITKRSAVKGKAFEVIKERLDKFGIRIVDLNIVDFKFSAQFNKAIEDVQIAKQQAAKAQQDLERVKIEAESAIQKAQGDAEAQRLQQQTLSPELLRKYEIDAQRAAIERWNGQLPTTTAGNGGALFNIPVGR